MENRNYVPEENQTIDQFRNNEQINFNNLKVASIGKVVGFHNNGYVVELIPKLDRETNIVHTLNFIYEKEHLVHNKYESSNAEEAYIVKKTRYVKKANENIKGKFILILFLDNYVSQIGNDKLNIDSSKTKHSFTNGYALQFIEMWPGKGGI